MNLYDGPSDVAGSDSHVNFALHQSQPMRIGRRRIVVFDISESKHAPRTCRPTRIPCVVCLLTNTINERDGGSRFSKLVRCQVFSSGVTVPDLPRNLRVLFSIISSYIYKLYIIYIIHHIYIHISS